MLSRPRIPTGSTAHTDERLSVSDTALLDALRAGDAQALDAALRRYWTPLVSYLLRLIDTREGAEDIAQRTFCQLWDRRATWRREGSLRGLLFRIARNFAISDRRRRLLERRFMGWTGVTSARNPTPADVLDHQQLRAALDRAVRHLPTRRREVFLLRCVHDLSYREIAEIMDISTQTVANQLSHALAALRHDLADLLDA